MKGVRPVRIVVAPPNVEAYMYKIENELEAFQTIVRGYIEAVTVTINEDTFCLFCNEDGLFKQLPFNRTVNGFNLHGTIAFLDREGKRGLTKEEANNLLNSLNHPHSVIR